MDNIKITNLIEKRAANSPNHLAVIAESGDWTYGELWSDVLLRVEALKSQGVRPGMGIGVMGQNSAEFISSILAVMHIGAVVLPISHNLKEDEIDKLCQRTKLHFLWDDGSNAIPKVHVDKDEMMVAGWRWTTSPFAIQDKLVGHVEHAALIRFTSGTTGKAKGVILSHQSIIERTECANHVLKLGEEDVVIWVLSMAYHFVVSILLYLRYGCSICICDSFMGDYILERTNEVRGTFLYVSPMHIRMLNKENSGRMMPTVKRIISTSMAISADLCEAFQQRYKKPITQAFGIIEVGLPVVNTREAGSQPTAIGFPLPAYEVRILNDDGVDLMDGEIGQLAMKGPGMFDAYLDPPMTREQALDHGFFLTGDLASRDESGRITIAGRKKNVINVSGNKAFPEEVEAVLNQFPGVETSRVKGFIHPLLSECVMAEVIRKRDTEVNVEQLITFCRKRLSTYKVPQRIIFVDELPMTDSGKIVRG